MVLGTLPDGAKVVVLLVVYHGPVEQGEAVMRTLRSFGPVAVDQVGVLPYPAAQSIVENFNPRGMRNYWKTTYIDGTSDEAIDVMLDYHQRSTSPLSHQILYTFGGAVARVGNDDTAVGHRDARHAFIGIGMWADPAHDEEQIAYIRDMLRAMQPFSSGGFYPNYDSEATAGQLRAALGPAKYEKLLSLKKKYDPDNFFCLNQNINPAGRNVRLSLHTLTVRCKISRSGNPKRGSRRNIRKLTPMRLNQVREQHD